MRRLSLFAFPVVLACACSSGARDADDTAGRRVAIPLFIYGEPLPTRPSVDDATDPTAHIEREARERAERLATWRALLADEPADTLWQRGEDMDEVGNSTDAAHAFTALLVHHPEHPDAPRAAMRAMTAYFRTGAYGAGLSVAEDALALVPDPVERARLERVLGNAYLAIPHHGLIKGGRFERGQWGMALGISIQRYRADRDRAVAHLESARQDMLESAGISVAERIEVQFDLVDALARFTPFDTSWSYWWYAWPESLAEDLVDAFDVDDDIGLGYGPRYELSQYEPRGLEVTEDGRIVFAERPATYDPDLGTTAKIKFLLHEVEILDDTEDKHFASQAILRQALLFQARDGAQRLQRLAAFSSFYDHPYRDEVAKRELHTLADDQVLGLVATHLQVFQPPEDESFTVLVKRLLVRYPETDAAEEARFLLGSFHQSRAQYQRAKNMYRAYLERHPRGVHAGSARTALELLDKPELAILDGRVQPAGRQAQLNIEFRNLTGARFEVRRVDLGRLTRDFKAQYRDGRTSEKGDTRVPPPHELGWYLVNNQDGALDRYASEPGPIFDRELRPDPGGRYTEASVVTPLVEAGLYVVQAFPRGGDPDANTVLATGLVHIERIAQIAKQGQDGGLLWLVDAATGAPIEGAEVEVFDFRDEWEDGKSVFHSRTRQARSDQAGMVALGTTKDRHLTIVTKDGETSYTGYGYGVVHNDLEEPEPTSDQATALVFTDRPVYRPGETVAIKVWAREKRAGEYLPATEVQRIRVRVYDARSRLLQDEDHQASEFGAVEIAQNLEQSAVLGSYEVEVEVDGRPVHVAGNRFRVEEYKAPEFTVAVTGAPQARLGEDVSVEIEARYLFGDPVRDGAVRYRVYRQAQNHLYAIPGPWDGLYGAGYGQCMYAYPWLDWWHQVPIPVDGWRWGWGLVYGSQRELVLEGQGRLDEHGKLALAIDTRPALEDHGDTDHRYLVEAEVTDLGRRLVAGKGEVLVTRSSYMAHVEMDRGFYTAGDEVGVHVAARRADASLFETGGALRIERIVYPDGQREGATETLIDTLPVRTQTSAPTRITWRAPETGLYKFTFVGRDASEREVRSSALAWVTGPGFDGRSYRFQDIELYTDKRAYRPGDTARVLINTDRVGAHVLFSARAEDGHLLEPTVLHLAGARSTIVDVPIGAGDVPNFFIEAVTVSQGKVMSQVREVFVPPIDAAMKVVVSGARDEYRPGDEVALTVRTSDPSGRPVAADVALAVFDSAVLYIQSEATPDAGAHFWARQRHHHSFDHNNLEMRYRFPDLMMHPDRQAAWLLGGAVGVFDENESDWRLSDTELGGAVRLASGGERTTHVKGPMRPLGGYTPPSSDSSSGVARQAEKTLRGPPEAFSNEEGAALAQREAMASRVRKNFADTAHFAPRVRTGPSGVARVRFRLPDNLTTWRVKAIGLDAGARVGEAETSFTSTQDLLIRMQAPRFFRERDRVVLSAIVHNRSTAAQRARVTLRVDQALLVPEGKATRRVDIPAMSEVRVDFWVRVEGQGLDPGLSQGKTRVRMDVVAEGPGRGRDSDAKELSFPVLVHGLEKTVARVDSMPMAEGPDERVLDFEIPAERRPDATRLEVRFSPSLAGGMLDALPYLLDYPYGCTEQTLSRFVPAVLVRRALQQSGGLRLDELPGSTNLDAQETTPGGQHIEARSAHEHQRLDSQPVFDQALMDGMIAAGIERIGRMQNRDGGWGWWGEDGSSRYTTAHVLDGLLWAQTADVELPPGMLQRGQEALKLLVARSLHHYARRDWVDNDDAYAAYVMSRYQARNDKLLDYLFERRRKLGAYGKLLAALAFHGLGEKKRAYILLDNAEQSLREDAENQTAWLETQTEGWWFWWHGDVETNALYLRALDAMGQSEPRSEERRARAPRVVKWLLNNRKNGYYWRSTRDTAQAVAALANHMQLSREGDPDMDVEVLLDGEVVRTVHIDRNNLLTFDSAIDIEGPALGAGPHSVTIRRKNGRGALYINAYLSYFSTEEDVAAAGLEVRVSRTYYKLVREEREPEVAGDRGQRIMQRQLGYRKVPLASGAEVASGDLILVELALEAKNDYTFLAFEDPKPAGMEPVALHSGRTYGEAVANMELRDERVVFFLRRLDRGTLHLRYRLRAEIPGQFHVMPTRGFGMYAPELRTNSQEMRVSVTE